MAPEVGQTPDYSVTNCEPSPSQAQQDSGINNELHVHLKSLDLNLAVHSTRVSFSNLLGKIRLPKHIGSTQPAVVK